MNYYFLILILFIMIGGTSCDKPAMTDACNNPHIHEVYDSFSITFPNAFTPNGDGLNDVFYPIIIRNYMWSGNTQPPIPIITDFQIKDWYSGEVFYSSTTNNASWNGTMQGNIRCDSYKYIATISFPDGHTKNYEGAVFSIPNVPAGTCLRHVGSCFVEENIIMTVVNDPIIRNAGC